jgi:FkbM family methyltransferase
MAEAAIENAPADYLVHGEFGLRIAYDPAIVSERVADSITRGAYERFEGRRLLGLVEDGDQILELGAGLGFISALLMLNKAIAKYHLVEADSRLIKLIRGTHKLNGVPATAEIHNCVVTVDAAQVAAGTVSFYLDQSFNASNLTKAERPLATIQVPVSSFHTVLEEVQPTCLIVDIEGAELDLFNGDELPGVRKILVEIHPKHFGLAGVRSIFRNLDASGFVPDVTLSSGRVVSFRRLEVN